LADLQNDVLLREIDEDLRHERYMALWRRFAPVLIGAAVVLIAVVAGYQFWNARMTAERAQAAEAFAAATREPPAAAAAAEAARTFDDIAKTAPGGYALMARLREGAALAESGQRDQAIASFHAIAGDTGVEETYRNLALVLAAMHEMAGGLQPQTAVALRTLADGTSPWRFNARELLAADLAQAKQTDEARALYSGLASDPATPAGIRTRARDMLTALGG
jgi:hypothetical protein